MKNKNWFLLALTALMTIMFGTCGGGSGKQINLVIYTQLANYSGKQIGWAAEILKEKFNVSVTIINDADGTFQTRMENGFLGDIVIFGTDGEQYMDAVDAGMLYDWEDENLLQEFGPYIWENMQLALQKNRNLSKGKIYGFGHGVAGSAEDHEDFFYYPYIRWDLYQQLNYPKINTLEDFIDVLAAMVELEPRTATGARTYGVSFFPDWDGDMVMMVKSTGALYGFDEFGFGLYDTKTQTFQPCLERDGSYLRSLRFYNRLFQKGLVDPDSMTQTFNDMAEKYTNGQAMFNIFSWMANTFNTEEHMASGKMMMCLAAADQKNIVYGLNVFGGNRVWSIGARTAYPALCMEIINWLCTPEGVLTYYYGPRGITWDYDEEGNAYLTETGMSAQQDKDKTTIEYGNYRGTYRDGEFQHNNTTWNVYAINPESTLRENYWYETWRSTLLSRKVYPIEQSWRDYMNAVRADDYLIDRGHISVAVGSTFSMGRRSRELTTTWNQVRECIKAGSWSAIYAGSDAEYFAIVEKMITDAKAYGYDECVEWTRQQAALRKAAELEALR